MNTFKRKLYSAAVAGVLVLASVCTSVRENSARIVACLVLAVAVMLGVTTPAEATMVAAFSLSVLDVFKQDAFGVISLTDAINKVPYVPGRAGAVIPWQEEGVATTTIMIEEVDGELQLINPSPRGGPGATSKKEKRTVRSLTIPHYEHNDAVYADEVQGVRAFGQESQVQTVRGLVDRRMQQHVQLKLDPTLEFQRLHAAKGIILNADGSTLYNLFTEFGVSQEAEVDFDLDNATPADGILRQTCDDVDRLVAENLGALTYTGLHGFCGKTFWQNLIAHKEVRAVYLASVTQATMLLNPMAFKTIQVGNITFEEYRGKNGATPFVNDDKVHIFPVGCPGWRTIYGPADYIETVNTIGRPRYVRQYEMPNGKGVNLDSQMNALNYFTRPKALILGRRT